MNKKILIISILAVFTLIAISFTSVVGSNSEKTNEKKESPLYKFRTSRAIGERLWNIIDFIKTRILNGHIFFIPFQWIRNYFDNDESGWYTKDPSYLCKC